MLMGIPFFILIITFGVCFTIGKKKGYEEGLDEIDKNSYPLKQALPAGYLIFDKIGISNFKKVNRVIYDKMLSIYGIETNENFRVYEANKIVYMFLGWLGVYLLLMANGSFSIPLVLLGPIGAVGMFFLTDSNFTKNFEKRNLEIKYDFPEFLSKLTLLINAGLTVENAWERIVIGRNKETILYYEMRKTYLDIKGNKGLEQSLKALTRRAKVQEITKFSSVILQGINRGSSEMVNALNKLAIECWAGRKSMARQKGEEASTKLLFPMILMLIAVFIVVLTPAVLQMGVF